MTHNKRSLLSKSVKLGFSGELYPVRNSHTLAHCTARTETQALLCNCVLSVTHLSTVCGMVSVLQTFYGNTQYIQWLYYLWLYMGQCNSAMLAALSFLGSRNAWVRHFLHGRLPHESICCAVPIHLETQTHVNF